MFGKELLTLPRDYYRQVFGKLGQGLVKVSINLPETYDSGAEIDYLQLMQLPKLCRFQVKRGDRDDPKKRKFLVLLELENQQEAAQKERQERIAFKKLMAARVGLVVRLGRGLKEGCPSDPQSLSAVLRMLP